MIHLPVDEAAERTVAACAVDSHHGARLALSRVIPADFHHPGYRRLIAAAVEIAGETRDRPAKAAAIARVHELWVVDLVEATRPVMWDTSGAWARRVIEAAEARRLALGHLHALGQLGVLPALVSA